ncbi:MAG: DUF2911 domain-containing protein [Myxococcota bacterium]
MSKTFSIAFTLALALPVTASAQRRPELPLPSPPAQVMQRVGLTDITVKYNSPGKKGRRIFGKLVPYGELWRTGANSATTVEFSRDVTFGDKAVPAGTYAVFTIPTRTKGWTVALNSNAKQSGTGGYDQKLDVARISVKPVLSSNRRERMTFIFSNTTEDSTRLDLEWDRMRVSVPIKVNTDEQVAKNIADASNGAWLPDVRGAAYLLDKGDIKAALTHVEKSVSIKSTWYNNWIHAQVLEKMGDKAKAKAAVEKALSMGDDSGAFKFYQPQMKAAVARLK